MIEKYSAKLISNLPEDIINSNLNIDLILDGGLFNGSYLIGAMYFLKAMEEKQYITIKKISACSIGTLVALMYYNNSLEFSEIFYDISKKNLEKNHNLNILKSLKLIFKNIITEDSKQNLLNKINNKFFITYYNIKKNKKIVKSHYKNYNSLINTIIKSCFLPFIVDGNLLYKNAYIDGLNPYIFPIIKNDKSNINTKILYLDLYGYDKLVHFINIKNEKNNFHRIVSGLLDIHSFFIKQYPTYMCSYVNDWNFLSKFNYNFKIFAEKIIKTIILIIYQLNIKINIYDSQIKNGIIIKIIKTIAYDIFIILLENYCI